jgi:hypothetical protein
VARPVRRVSRQHRLGPWFRAARGRANQPAGRHTPEHIAAQRAAYAGQPNADGRYPVGQPLRVPRDDGQLDRGDNDPHQRYTITLQEVTSAAL